MLKKYVKKMLVRTEGVAGTPALSHQQPLLKKRVRFNAQRGHSKTTHLATWVQAVRWTYSVTGGTGPKKRHQSKVAKEMDKSADPSAESRKKGLTPG